MKALRYILTAAAILMMILIFWFSSQTADESTEVSNHAGRFICSIFVPGFQEMPEEVQKEYIDSVDHAVRKCAHASEYLVLGVLCASSLLLWFKKNRYLLIALGWVIAGIYAVTDEIHQIYVPGRAFMVTDILIDSAGALVGVILLSLTLRVWRYRS